MSKSTLRTGIIVLGIVTAIIHLILGVVDLPKFFGVIFILNGIGYLGLIWATIWTPSFLQTKANLIHYVFIAYTVVTIILFFVFQGGDAFTSIPGLITKADEVLLIVALISNLRADN